MPAAVDTRRSPLFSASEAFSQRAPGVSAAAHAAAVFDGGLEAAALAILTQTAGCHHVDAGPFPSAVVASSIPTNASGCPSASHPGPYTDLALITKAPDRRVDLHRESGRVEAVAPCFLSLIHRTVLARGKWMYEVTMHSDGLMQIGWSPPHDAVDWSTQLGVGDFVHSTAYDGHRRSLWKTSKRVTPDEAPDANTPPTGDAAEVLNIPAWVDGDVITACIDLDAGVATYYSNGTLTARTNVPCLANMPADEDPAAEHMYLMCAAVTLGRNEMAAINYGDAPFAFPQPAHAGVAWAAPTPVVDGATSSPPPAVAVPCMIRAHVASEVICAVAAAPGLSAGDRYLAAARVTSRLSTEDMALLGGALGHTLLRPVSAELSAEELEEWGAAVMNDAAFFAGADAAIPLVNAVVPDAAQVLRSVMAELGAAARPIGFNVASNRNINRRARAALRLAAHVVTTHKDSTQLIAAWPHPDGWRLERDLTPFTKPRYATDSVLGELVTEIDLADPLATPSLRFAAQDTGNDLFLHINPFREHILDPIVRGRPWILVNFILRIAERQDPAATSGSVLFALLASCIVRHSKLLTEQQFAETYASRASLLSQRAVRIEAKRLGGPTDSVRRRCGLLGAVIAPEGDTSVNTLLIAVSWLFHATARRQIPSVVRTVSDLQKAVKTLRESGGDVAANEATVRRIQDLARRAVLSRGRIAHDGYVHTLTDFVTLLSGLIHRYGMAALRHAAPKHPGDKNTSPSAQQRLAEAPLSDADLFHAAMHLTHMRPCEAFADFMLLPSGFVTTTSLALQMLRRSMPFGLAAHMERHPELPRAAMLTALCPLLEQSELSDGLHLGSLILEPPTANPIPHCDALTATLTPAHVAIVFARCLVHMQNDMSWSAGCNLLSCLSQGSALAAERRSDGSSSGWLMWANEVEPADMIVPAHPDVSTTGLARDALAMLRSAQDMANDTAALDPAKQQMHQICDFAKGFKALVGRTSWLHSEFGVSAQEELMGRGTAQTRQRMQIVFDLFQRNLHTIGFFLEVAGDRLLTDTDKDDATTSNAIVVQEMVELLMLVLRDYGNKDSLVYTIHEADPAECKQMHPWRIIAPVLDTILLILRPDDKSAPEGPNSRRYNAWKRACQRMLTSPRIGWDVAHVVYAAERLRLPELIRDKKVSGPMSKADWLLASEEWLPTLKALHDLNVTNGMSPAAAAKKARKAAAGLGADTLAAIGATMSTASLDDFEDETLCSICCVDVVNARFEPCGHQSCRVCIDRQLAGQQKRCFFCNADVVQIVDVAIVPATPLTPAPPAGVSSPSRPQSAAFPAATALMTPTTGRTSSFPAIGDVGDDAEGPTTPGGAHA